MSSNYWNKLNEKKSEHTFVKKLICELLLKFLWEFGGRQIKNVQPGVMFSVDSFTRKSKLFFDKSFWYVNDKPCIKTKSCIKQKLSYLKKKKMLLAFYRGSKEATLTTRATLRLLLGSYIQKPHKVPGWALGSNFVTRLPVTFGWNKYQTQWLTLG